MSEFVEVLPFDCAIPNEPYDLAHIISAIVCFFEVHTHNEHYNGSCDSCDVRRFPRYETFGKYTEIGLCAVTLCTICYDSP